MKNEKIKTNKTKIIARVMLVVILLASATNLCACMVIPIDWEVYSHEEFVRKIEKYNSINNGSIDTFISIDFDSNNDVSEKAYCFASTTSNKSFVLKHGYYDIFDKYYSVSQMFYLISKTENNSFDKYAYKIKYKYNRNHTQNNFMQGDRIEIEFAEHTGSCYSSKDLHYQESLELGSNTEDENMIYNYCYHFDVYINDVEFGYIHISSIDEPSIEKLDEICQLLLDNLVIINPEG